jgi:hypothetical protein
MSVDLRSIKTRLVLRPGDYTIDLKGDDVASNGVRSTPFSVGAGAVTHVVVDCSDLSRLALTLTANAEVYAEAFLLREGATVESGLEATPLMTFYVWPGEVDTQVYLLPPATYELRLACVVEEELDPGVELTIQRSVSLDGNANIDLHLDELIVAELERLLPMRPELRALLVSFE